RGDVVDHLGDRLPHVRGEEVTLHVVDEQCGPIRVEPPHHPSGRTLCGRGQRVGLDPGQGHDYPPFLASAASAARSSRLLVLPTPVTGNESTTMTRSGTLNAATPRSRTKRRSSAPVNSDPSVGMT